MREIYEELERRLKVVDARFQTIEITEDQLSTYASYTVGTQQISAGFMHQKTTGIITSTFWTAHKHLQAIATNLLIELLTEQNRDMVVVKPSERRSSFDQLSVTSKRAKES
jgi:hypothetical protein